jgi:hypothetical protein
MRFHVPEVASLMNDARVHRAPGLSSRGRLLLVERRHPYRQFSKLWLWVNSRYDIRLCPSTSAKAYSLRWSDA